VCMLAHAARRVLRFGRDAASVRGPFTCACSGAMQVVCETSRCTVEAVLTTLSIGKFLLLFNLCPPRARAPRGGGGGARHGRGRAAAPAPRPVCLCAPQVWRVEQKLKTEDQRPASCQCRVRSGEWHSGECVGAAQETVDIESDYNPFALFRTSQKQPSRSIAGRRLLPFRITCSDDGRPYMIL
jgi:hypothetical protein